MSEPVSDSVLCLGRRQTEHPGSARAWESHIQYFVQSREYRGLYDLTGHQVKFDWRNFTGPATTKSLQKNQEDECYRISVR